MIEEYRRMKRQEARDAEVAMAVRASEGIASMLGATAAPVADRNIVEGEIVLAGGAAYEAIVNIARGETFVEGVNVVLTDITSAINALLQSKED